VIDQSLTFAGYQSEVVGKAIELTTADSGEDMQKQFSTVGTGEDSPIYYAALLNFKDINGSVAGYESYFLTLLQKGTAAFKDGGTGSEFARVYVKQAGANTFNIGVSRNNTTIEYAPNAYNLNETYLLVVKYYIWEGTTNDEVSIFINPTPTAEPTYDASFFIQSGADVTTRGFEAIELRQGSTPLTGTGKRSPNVIVDALRVANRWTDLFETDEETAVPNTTLAAEKIVRSEIFNMNGARVAMFDGEAVKSSLPNGAYVVKSLTDKNNTLVQKLLIKK
jgi:hypothetical protein